MINILDAAYDYLKCKLLFFQQKKHFPHAVMLLNIPEYPLKNKIPPGYPLCSYAISQRDRALVLQLSFIARHWSFDIFDDSSWTGTASLFTLLVAEFNVVANLEENTHWYNRFMLSLFL